MKTLKRSLLAALLFLLAALLTWAVSASAFPTTHVDMTKNSATFFDSGVQQQLEVAVREGDPAAITRAIERGAQVDARGKHDVTALMVAVDVQSARAVATLLHAGANPNLTASDGAGAVHLAVENHAATPDGHDILAMIMRGGGDPNTLRPDRDPVIARFIYDHDIDDLKWFASIGANLDILGKANRPLITDVAMAQNWDSVWAMIEMGARFDYEESLHPLSRALETGYASSPDSPLYPYKFKVWQLLKDKGVPVRPLRSAKPSKPALP